MKLLIRNNSSIHERNYSDIIITTDKNKCLL